MSDLVILRYAQNDKGIRNFYSARLYHSVKKSNAVKGHYVRKNISI
jgi:hypothetical protein